MVSYKQKKKVTKKTTSKNKKLFIFQQSKKTSEIYQNIGNVIMVKDGVAFVEI